MCVCFKSMFCVCQSPEVLQMQVRESCREREFKRYRNATLFTLHSGGIPDRRKNTKALLSKDGWNARKMANNKNLTHWITTFFFRDLLLQTEKQCWNSIQFLRSFTKRTRIDWRRDRQSDAQTDWLSWRQCSKTDKLWRENMEGFVGKFFTFSNSLMLA